MEKKMKLNVKENAEGELYIEFPPNFLPEDWTVNTPLTWIDNKDGSWTIQKSKKYVLVECISQFKNQYVIEIPEDAKCDATTYALDTVTMEDYTEFTQKHLGETIIGSREVKLDEILSICDEINDYAKGWSTELKIKNFITSPKDKDKDF